MFFFLQRIKLLFYIYCLILLLLLMARGGVDGGATTDGTHTVSSILNNICNHSTQPTRAQKENVEID